MYLHRYRESVNARRRRDGPRREAPDREGHPGTSSPSQGLYQGATTPSRGGARRRDHRPGAQGPVAIEDIYPGEQLTAAASGERRRRDRHQLTGDQRAISVPIDAAHGMIGQRPGRRPRRRLRRVQRQAPTSARPTRAAERPSSSDHAGRPGHGRPRAGGRRSRAATTKSSEVTCGTTTRRPTSPSPRTTARSGSSSGRRRRRATKPTSSPSRPSSSGDRCGCEAIGGKER